MLRDYAELVRRKVVAQIIATNKIKIAMDKNRKEVKKPAPTLSSIQPS